MGAALLHAGVAGGLCLCQVLKARPLLEFLTATCCCCSKTHAKSQAHEWIEELALTEIVGKGGFGVVYRGTWKGSVAAVKVRRGLDCKVVDHDTWPCDFWLQLATAAAAQDNTLSRPALPS